MVVSMRARSAREQGRFVMRLVCHLGLVLTGLSSLAVAATASAQPEAAPVAAPAALEPPVLLTFVQAPYPPEALEQKLTAEVVLRLDIERRGKGD